MNLTTPYPFYKKHKTQNRFWSFNDKAWIKYLPTKRCVIITYRCENVHPSVWLDGWFK